MYSGPTLPPIKKTKKELEMENLKWEGESMGGISQWTCLADDEKKGFTRAKWAREMGDYDDQYFFPSHLCVGC